MNTDMLRARNLYSSTPVARMPFTSRCAPFLTERVLASAGLFLSMIFIAGKLYYNNREELRAFLLDRQLLTYQILITDGAVMYKHGWTTVIKHSQVWLPFVCGLLSIYFTWLMVYLDSNIPGVKPPSPLSPSKYKVTSGHSFHLNYLFAVMVGVLVFLYTYWIGLGIKV